MKLICSLVAGAFLAIAPATSGAATDTFTRTVASGWGTADVGGAWTAESGAADFSVNGTTGRISLAAAGANRAIFLSGTAVDWDVSTSVVLDKTPTGGSAWLYHELRRPAGNTNSYRLLARFAADGRTFVSASRVVGGTEVCDRERGRRPLRQLPHRLQPAGPGDGRQSDDDQDQGVGRQRARHLELHRHGQRRSAGRGQGGPPQLHLAWHHQRPHPADRRQLRRQRDCASASSASSASAAASPATAAPSAAAATATASPATTAATARHRRDRHVLAHGGQRLGHRRCGR